jgi:hypothetical protein
MMLYLIFARVSNHSDDRHELVRNLLVLEIGTMQVVLKMDRVPQCISLVHLDLSDSPDNTSSKIGAVLISAYEKHTG